MFIGHFYFQSASLSEAFSCIDQQSDDIDDGYTASIVAYAYSMYQPKSNAAASAFTKLQDMAISGEMSD